MPTQSGHTRAIRASRVIGTDVFAPTGERIGKVEDIILDKTSNNILFAVVGFGGFLGMGEKYHPMPWSTLDYEKNPGGFVVGFTRQQLEAAPCDTIDELTANDGMSFRDRVYDYYQAPRSW
jgi:sporulation protein YlmC with PRC-barrel domain